LSCATATFFTLSKASFSSISP